MYKAKELRDQSLEELEANYDESCRKLFELRGEAKVRKKNDQPHRIKHARKDIARLLTVMTEKRRQK
jgi:large subunit ribosomal protein L29